MKYRIKQETFHKLGLPQVDRGKIIKIKKKGKRKREEQKKLTL